MNYSEENEKHHSGFKDIAVDDDSEKQGSAPPIVYFEDPVKESHNPNYHGGYPVSYAVPPTIQVPSPATVSSPDISKLERIEMHSRIVKWTSLVLSIFAFLFLLPGAIPLVVTFVFPILGFIAAHRYSDCLTRFYSVYLILIVIVQIIVMAMLGGVAYIVFQCFVLISELVILLFNFKLSREITSLTLDEKNILNGTQSKNHS